MAWSAALYFSMYSGVALCAACLTLVVVSVGKTKSLGVVVIAGGQHALDLTASAILPIPFSDAMHVEMSGVVMGEAKAAGREVRLAVV